MSKTQIDEVKVFISSAMTTASDVDWPNLRASIYDALLEDDQFHPFGIENEASSRTSLQFFLDQVEQTDFVVGIVGNDLRQGTKRELELAFEKRKKILLFFIGNEQTQDALELKMTVQKGDLCCYRIVDSAFNLPEKILANLKSELTRLSREYDRPVVADNDKPALLEYNELPKTVFSLFGKAGSVLRQRLGLIVSEAEETSGVPAPLEELGREALLWLLDNKPFSLASHDDSIKNAIPALEEVEDKWGLRASCGSALHGDFHDAYLRLHAKLGKANPSEEWQYGIALIDLRNFASLKGDVQTYFAVQDKINNLQSPIVFPACEHCLRQADEALRDIEEWKRGITVNTRGFNQKYETVLDAIINAFFIAIIYGCFSRVHAIRDYLSRSLSLLAAIYEEPAFAYQALRLSFVGGNEKTARNICRSDWPLVSNIVPANADDLWNASKLCGSSKRTKIQCVCVELLAPYFSEQTTLEIKSILMKSNTRQASAKLWTQAMKSISMRLDSDTLVNTLSAVLETENSGCSGCFTTILSNIHWKEVDNSVKDRFAASLVEHWKWYLDVGCPAEAIAQLTIDGILPMDFSQTVADELTGLAKAGFESRLAGQFYCEKLFEQAVATAEKQFATNSTGYSLSMFSVNPYPLINESIGRSSGSLLKTPAGTRLISLFLEAAKSNAPDEVLSPILESMVVCASHLLCTGESLPAELIEAVASLRYTSSTMMLYTFGGSTEPAWQVRLSALRTISDMGHIDEAISIYLSSRNDYETAHALAILMPALIKTAAAKDSNDMKVLAFTLSELALDSHAEVRGQVPAGAVELIGTSENEYGYRLLTLLVKDNNPEVRFAAMKSCSDDRVEPPYRNMVLDLLAQDANYHLRYHAERLRLETEIEKAE